LFSKPFAVFWKGAKKKKNEKATNEAKRSMRGFFFYFTFVARLHSIRALAVSFKDSLHAVQQEKKHRKHQN
jgi:hypothetical protein